MPGAAPSQTVTLQTLQAQLGETQSALASLHQQMVSSSELIQALANQNAQLIVRIEVLRKRLAWLTWGLATLAVVLASLWIAKAA
jgi:chromosome segregation ATPase